MVTSVLASWRLKYDVGFWRPFQAIAGADTDGNPATTPEANWVPLVPNRGLHFRDAMDDGYYLGHTTADRVMKVIH